MEYMEAKRSYTEAKAKQRALHKRVQTLQQKNQPMHDFKKHLENENEKLVTLLSVRLEFSPIGWLHYPGSAS